MIGSRLGPFDITAKLGEGGMGEVYRATDTKLKREVAIKVLPAAFTEDKERLARFEREAQLLAQLHHPNIASIFGLEESEGIRALVMELVEGPTLAERLEAGSFSLTESFSVALQIAQALEEAHEKGIVHRDLKPQNIKASSEGKVKVLDFGLAKAMDPAGTASGSGPASTLAKSPTLTMGATQMGVILGTAAYMSPEQAKGMAVDKRSDIWAFGVVLYETLVGGSLFSGDSVGDTLAAVIRADIDLGKLPPETPSAIRQLLRRCLERNPKNRLHDIADARIVLEEVLSGAHDEPRAAAGAASDAGRSPRRTLAGMPALAAMATLALVVGLGAGWVLRKPAPPDPLAEARWALAIPDGYALSPGEFPQLALSEDGRLQVVVVVDSTLTSHLLLRSIDELEPRLLPGTEGATTPFFSPDGEWIGFFRGQSLVKMSARGGPLTRLAEVSGQTRGASWSSDGFIYLSVNVSSGLSRVSENGGALSAVTEPDRGREERTHRWPQALPDGGAVLFTNDSLATTEFYDDARIEAVRPATGERRVLVEGASQARYATGGRLVFARGGSLYSVAFDPRSLAVQGTPELAVPGVATDVGSGAAQFALSPSGAMLWAPGGLSAQYQYFWVDRSGAETPVAIPPVPYNESALSPDGKRVALMGGAGGTADLWVADLERGTQTRLTVGESNINPIWSPDGARIAYTVRLSPSGQDPHWQIAWKLADGSRDAEVLLDSALYPSPSGFTPDGGKLLYNVNKPDGQGADIYLLPLTGPRTPELLLGGPFVKRDAVVSPDGRWLAYSANEAGPAVVFVRPFPAGEGRWQISGALGSEPRWGPDSRELFFRADTSLYRVEVDTKGGFSAGKPERLFDRVSNAGAVRTYGVAPDGRAIFTPRAPEGRGARRTVYLDLGFARRIAATSLGNGDRP